MNCSAMILDTPSSGKTGIQSIYQLTEENGVDEITIYYV